MENNHKPWPWLDALLIFIAVISAVALVLPSFLREKIPVPCPFDELKFEHGKELTKAKHEAFWIGVKAAQTAATNKNFRITEAHEHLIGLRP